MLHRRNSPCRFDEKTIRRPSGVQASPRIIRLSDVRRLACPPCAGAMKISVVLGKAPIRTKAIDFPSGENTGERSPSDCFGSVTSIRSPLAKSATPIRLEVLTKANRLPAGDHDRSVSLTATSGTRLAAPPKAGT